MKKILQPIKNFFLSIWHVIDKFLIFPLTKLVLRITDSFDNSGKKFENWLSKSNTLLFISLFLAIIVFIVVDQRILVFSQSSAEVLKNQPVEVKYNEEAYVIEGIPESVDITIIGNATDLYIAKQSPSNGVKLDLSDLKPGQHKINLNYSQAVGTAVEYSVNPAVANITIYQKVSETRILTYDILNQEKLDTRYAIRNVKLESDRVVIKGAEYQLKRVATVKALIDVSSFVKQEVGTMTVKDIALKAYDENGEVIDVEILPNKVNATLEITSSSKELPIRVIPKGEVVFGKAISNITLSESTVMVYGNEEDLAQLEYVPLEISVDGLSENQEYKLELPKPVGVNMMSVNNVTVTITLDNATTRDIDGILIEYLNFDDEKYSLQAATEEDRSISVSLLGVESVVEDIEASDIHAYIDLNGYTEGTHEVDVIVEGMDTKVQYTAKRKKVKIIIKKK